VRHKQRKSLRNRGHLGSFLLRDIRKARTWKQQDPDGFINFTTYNAKGEPDYLIQAVVNPKQRLFCG
jgi:hypothetical protein